jgi:hypothetical protein
MMRRRCGYVLVLTLGLLVLAATAMVSVARSSLRHANDARAAADELQRRWGVTSCRLAALPVAEDVLIDQETRRKKPVPAFRTQLRLGGLVFDLVLADEQAKTNLNVLLDEADLASAESRLREALGGGRWGDQLRLRPLAMPQRAATTSTTQPIIPQRITGFGQVFEDLPPEKLLDGPAALLTCWGDGRINVRRASESALRLGVTPTMTRIEIAGLLQARDAALSGLAPTQSAQVAYPRNANLTQTSRCHSLWIVVSSQQRQWHYFTVVDEPANAPATTASFVW